MNHRSNFIQCTFAALLTCALLLPQAVFGAECSSDTPARPVPQFTDETPDSLWPIDPLTDEIKLRPAGVPVGVHRNDIGRLPLDRDSTDYETKTAPGLQSGHELFQDVAIPGSRTENAPVAQWMVVAYNAGLSVWDIGTDPARPDRVAPRDGWAGHWKEFPHFGEVDTYVHGVDVVRVGDTLFIGVAAEDGVGFSIWTFNTQNRAMQQRYQDLNVTAKEVSIETDPNGDTYAYVADASGIRVYNMSASLSYSNGACVDQKGSSSCGIYKGRVGSITNSKHVTTLVANGETYVAASDGQALSNTPLKLQIWEVKNPNSPGPTPLSGASVQRFNGLSDAIHTPQLFTYKNKHYLSLVDAPGGKPEMRLYDVTSCLTAGCATNPGTLKVKESLKNSFPRTHFLDVSFSNGEPFLHYGMETTGLFDSGFERLWELASISNANALSPLPELTDGGGSYVDSCGNEVDYFGDYYINNDNGLKRFDPRHAVFNGAYLYRAGTSVVDVHVRGGESTQPPPTDPTISPRLQDGGSIDSITFWIDEEVMLEADVLNCADGATDWCWNASDNNANVNSFPANGCNAAYGKTHSMTFECTSSPTRCADTTATVSSYNMSADCQDTSLDPQEVQFKLKDPQVQVKSLNTGGTSFPICQTLALDASVDGRGAAQWAWKVDDQAIPGCSGTVAAGLDLSGESFACQWDTSGLSFDSIFVDGFELGCGRWGAGCPLNSMRYTSGATKQNVQTRKGSLEVKGGGDVTAELEIKNGSGVVVHSATQSLSFFDDGDPAFDGPLSLPDVNGSVAVLQAPATGTTAWRWEVEDPVAGTVACSFDGSKQCVIEETFTDTLEYLWLGAGTYTYRVWISNCVVPSSASATGTVEVSDAVVPEIVGFEVSRTKLQGTGDGTCYYDLFGNCGNSGAIYCPKNTPIDFEVEMLNAGSFAFTFDWERASLGDLPEFTSQAPKSSNVTTFIFDHSFGNSAPATPFPTANVQFGDEFVLSDPLVIGGSCP